VLQVRPFAVLPVLLWAVLLLVVSPLLAVLSLVLPVLSSARPSVPVLVLLLAVLSALLPVSAVASFPSSHGFFYFKYTSLFFNAASYISSARLIGSITITLLP